MITPPEPPDLDPSLSPAEHWKAGYRAGYGKRASVLGKHGGKARKSALTPERRKEIAREAGRAGGRGRKKETPWTPTHPSPAGT
nr:hypothetical protein [uncultured Rhodopila sp.]